MCLQRINKEGSMGWHGFDIEAKLDTKKREKKKTFNKKMKNFVAMASRVRVEIKRHKNKMLLPLYFEIILRSRLYLGEKRGDAWQFPR